MNTLSVVWGRAVSIIVCSLLSVASAFAQVPLAGPNVNMVSERPFLRPSPADSQKSVIKWEWPYNDVFLTKQNEPSLAVSSLNPDHLLGGANDYRFVDPTFTCTASLGEDCGTGDAWVQLYGSITGGRTWFSFPLADCPYNIPACAEPAPASNPAYTSIKGLQAAADPTVRAGPYGTFFVSFIAFNRDSSSGSVTAIRRYVDRNNKLAVNVDPSKDSTQTDGNPFVAEKLNIIDIGTKGQFKDKSWNIAGVPGSGGTQGLTCPQPIGGRSGLAAFPVYIVYSNFTGQGQNQHPAVYVAMSKDCGETFAKGVKVSNSLQASQGASIAIDPTDNTAYVAWRVFGTSGQADAIYFSKQTDPVRNTWSNPKAVVSPIHPFDQPASGGSIRTEDFPSIAVSVDSGGNSRVHIAWAERKGTVTVDPNNPLKQTCTVPDAKVKCDARIQLATSNNKGNSWSVSGVDDIFPDPVPLDPNNVPPGRGHQIQPALTFAGGKLVVVWLDQRLDQTVGVIDCTSAGNTYNVAKCNAAHREPVANRALGQTDRLFTPLIVDDPSPDPSSGLQLTRRHTLDVYAAMADPGDKPAFSSNRVSQYPYGTPRSQTAGKGKYLIMERQWNVVGYPIFAQDTMAFLGDYVDVAGQTMFAAGGTYKWNTGWNAPGCGNPAAGISCRTVFHTSWSDNRDIVVGGGAHTSSYILHVDANGVATTTPNLACVPGQNGSRNQNIYTAVISDTAIPYTTNNAKQFNTSTPRGVVVGVENLSTSTQTFTLTIPSVPAGYTYASFDATDSTVTSVPLTVAPRSTGTRSVYLQTSVSPSPTIAINFYNGPATGNPLQQIVLNPDPAAALVTNTGWQSANDLANNDLANIAVRTLDMTNSDMTNMDMANLDMTNLDMANLDMTNLDLTNLDMANSDLTNSDMTNLDLTNSDLTNLDMANLDMANFSATASDMTNSDMANLDLMNLDFTNSDLANLDFTNSDLTNASFADSASTVINRGNTDTTLGVKLLTNGSAGAKVQLVLRKTTVKPSIQANTCRIGGVQQTSQVANQPAVCVAPDPSNVLCANGDTTGSTIGTFNPSTAVLTMPLAPGEKAQVTVRAIISNDNNQSDTTDFATWGSKPTVTDANSNTRTRIPLIIRTLGLNKHARALVTTTFDQPTDPQITAWGGFLCDNLPCSTRMTWSPATVSGVPAMPTFASITAADSFLNGRLLVSPSVLTVVPSAQDLANVSLPATYKFALQVQDNSNPKQKNVQRFALVVDKALTTTVLSSSKNPSTYGDTVTLTATVSPDPSAVGPPPRTGMVKFMDGSATLGSTSLDPSSVATLTVPTPPGIPAFIVGTHNLTATYSGDNLYAGSSGALSQVVNPVAPTIIITATPTPPPPVYYTDAAPTLNVTSNSSGAITFSAAGTACSVTTAGVVTIKAAGTCTVTASQAASGNYSAGSASVTITITPTPLTITAVGQTMTYGDALPVFTVTYSRPQPPANEFGGTLAYTLTSASTPAVCTPPSTVNGAGSCAITPSGLTSNNYAITFAPGTLTVNKATPVFSNLAVSPTSIAPNTPTNVAVSGTLKYKSVFPSGTVGVTLNGVTKNPLLDASGNFSTTFSVSLAVGSYPIALSYAGDSNFNSPNPNPDSSLKLRVEGFVQVSATMIQQRSYHTANLLQDGRVVIAGGLDGTGSPTATSEIYCAVAVSNCAPADVGKFKAVGNLPSKSAGHATVLLPDGRLFSTGGGNSSSEFFSPQTNSWSPGGGMSSNRSYHTMSLIPNTGKVLIIGGADNSGKTVNTTIVYDVATGSFSSGPAMNAVNGRERHTATVLADGRVLVAGGRYKQGNNYNALNTTEIYAYNAGTNSFSVSAGPVMASPRYSHDAALLLNGQVVIAGGNDGTADVATAEICTAGGSCTGASANLGGARRDLRLSAITNSRLLASGGQNGTTPSANADVFSGTGFSAAPNPLFQARTNHTSTTLLADSNGVVRVLVTGGLGAGAAGTLNSAELYFSAP